MAYSSIPGALVARICLCLAIVISASAALLGRIFSAWNILA
jgi:hypothetical protein